MKNRLSHERYFKLCKMIETHRKEFETTERTLIELARVASTLCDFGVCERSLAQAMKSIGINRPNATISPNKQLNSKVNKLARCLHDLCKKIGEPFPEDFWTKDNIAA
jgi:hypothetical protein